MSSIQQQLLVTGIGQLLGAVIRVRLYEAAELLGHCTQSSRLHTRSMFTIARLAGGCRHGLQPGRDCSLHSRARHQSPHRWVCALCKAQQLHIKTSTYLDSEVK